MEESTPKVVLYEHFARIGKALANPAPRGVRATRRSGTGVYYRLADEEVGGVVRQVKDFARRRLADVERAARDYLGDVEALEPVSLEELGRRTGTCEVLVLDVRPRVEY